MIIDRKMREAGDCILSIRNRILVWLFLGALLQAEPVDSYAFLTKLNRLEQNLIRFSRHYLLYEAFPHQQIHALGLRDSYKTYERAIRQSASVFKGGNTRQTLTRFVDAKNLMQNILSDKHSSQNFSNLLQMEQKLESEIEQISEVKTLALEPEQRILFALTQMQLLLEEMARRYVINWHHAPDQTKQEKVMPTQIASFERLIRLCDNYVYWSAKERTRMKRILATWKVLKKNLSLPERPLLVGLGVAHMQSLLIAIQAQHEELQ